MNKNLIELNGKIDNSTIKFQYFAVKNRKKSLMV